MGDGPCNFEPCSREEDLRWSPPFRASIPRQVVCSKTRGSVCPVFEPLFHKTRRIKKLMHVKSVNVQCSLDVLLV
ncbi:hypothetical protein TNCV_5033791 [Trichonephila clavipes]|nr:hypothetical protein TNCV_5033791 [Trichonephila clavipes]